MRINRYSDPCYWSANSCAIQKINYPRFNKMILSEHWMDFSSNQQLSPKKFLEMTDEQMRSPGFTDLLNQMGRQRKKEKPQALGE